MSSVSLYRSSPSPRHFAFSSPSTLLSSVMWRRPRVCASACLCWIALSCLLLIPCVASAQPILRTDANANPAASSNPIVTPISLSTAFLRILGAFGLGGLIGLEREITNITRHLRGMAGIRTHAVICTGSCLIQLVSTDAYAEVSGYETSRDPSRLAAQAVSGIGFVGAGAILKGGENVIYGLTSAASIWLVMAVGLAVGLGYWTVTASTVALVVVGMMVTKRAERAVFGRRFGPGYTAEMEVTSSSGPDILHHILDCVGKQLHITTISIDKRQPQPPPASPQPPSHPPSLAVPTADVAPPSSATRPVSCTKFVVSLDNCSRASFMRHVQCTVTLLCEDEAVYKVESRNVQEVRDGPSHRLEWTEPSSHDTQQMDEQMEQLKREVRQRRTSREGPTRVVLP